MNTAIDIETKAKALLKQAEQLRRQERAQAIRDIQQAIQLYGITVQEITGKGAVRYVGPNGERWSGRGRRPGWLTNALDAGASIEQFRITVGA